MQSVLASRAAGPSLPIPSTSTARMVAMPVCRQSIGHGARGHTPCAPSTSYAVEVPPAASASRAFRQALPAVLGRRVRGRCASLPEPAAKQLAAPGSATTESLDGVSVALKEEEDGKGIEYDEETKTVRIPLSTLQAEMSSRRTKMVLFTCNKCGQRTARMVNPLAWDNGVVFGQCATEECKVWHVLSANNKKIYEEINYKTDPRYADPPSADADATGSTASADSP